MNTSELTISFLAGALTFAFILGGLFFLKFWKKTKDRLFLFFAIAFWLFGINQIATLSSTAGGEKVELSYLLRIIGYILIFIAILEKNTKHRKND